MLFFSPDDGKGTEVHLGRPTLLPWRRGGGLGGGGGGEEIRVGDTLGGRAEGTQKEERTFPALPKIPVSVCDFL